MAIDVLRGIRERFLSLFKVMLYGHDYATDNKYGVRVSSNGYLYTYASLQTNLSWRPDPTAIGVINVSQNAPNIDWSNEFPATGQPIHLWIDPANQIDEIHWNIIYDTGLAMNFQINGGALGGLATPFMLPFIGCGNGEVNDVNPANLPPRMMQPIRRYQIGFNCIVGQPAADARIYEVTSQLT
jgi:hypothetical protein